MPGHRDKPPGADHPGEAGQAAWRTMTNGEVRMRIVEWSPGSVADHWCDRGHVIYGMRLLLQDGASFPR